MIIENVVVLRCYSVMSHQVDIKLPCIRSFRSTLQDLNLKLHIRKSYNLLINIIYFYLWDFQFF